VNYLNYLYQKRKFVSEKKMTVGHIGTAGCVTLRPFTKWLKSTTVVADAPALVKIIYYSFQ
jgi:hypothetical protein